jgi:beta-glucanase (GH16 family)
LTLFILVAGLLMLFAGYPVLYHYITQAETNKGGFGLGGTNGTGQVAMLNTVRPMIDVDTPTTAQTFSSATSGKTYNLQFSDEFEVEGRTFWPGDDQYVR